MTVNGDTEIAGVLDRAALRAERDDLVAELRESAQCRAELGAELREARRALHRLAAERDALARLCDDIRAERDDARRQLTVERTMARERADARLAELISR